MVKCRLYAECTNTPPVKNETLSSKDSEVPRVVVFPRKEATVTLHRTSETGPKVFDGPLMIGHASSLSRRRNKQQRGN